MFICRMYEDVYIKHLGRNICCKYIECRSIYYELRLIVTVGDKYQPNF